MARCCLWLTGKLPVLSPLSAISQIHKLARAVSGNVRNIINTGTKDSRDLEGPADQRGRGGSVHRESQQMCNDRRMSAEFELMTACQETAAI
jgi:hypothetical protein